MRELHGLTLKEVSDCIVERIAENKNISKTLARKLFINAISYNIVIAEIENQIDFLLETEN